MSGAVWNFSRKSSSRCNPSERARRSVSSTSRQALGVPHERSVVACRNEHTHPKEVKARILETWEYAIGEPDVGHRSVLFPSNLKALFHIRSLGSDLRELLFVIDVLNNLFLTRRGVAYRVPLLGGTCLRSAHLQTSVMSPRRRVRGLHLCFHRQGEEPLRLEWYP